MVDGIIALLIGAAVFIVGMNMMSSGLKKVTGPSLKKLFKKTQNSSFACVGIGTAVTALIQSSAASSVMTIGFLSVGALTIFQAVNIILGAYLGTTVTGVIASLSSFDFSKYLVLLAVVGVVMMFFKKEKVKAGGEIAAGLGLLFFGLSTMSGAFKAPPGGTSELLEGVKSIFSNPVVQFPLILLLLGAAFTALVQSSSATTGIVIVLLGQGALSIQSGFYLVIGATIGTLITMFLATIGGDIKSKKTLFICFTIRVIAALLGTVVVMICGEQIGQFLTTVFGNNQLALAMFLVLYNLIFLIPSIFSIKPLERLSNLVIKDKNLAKKQKSIKFINKRMLSTPSVAVEQAKNELMNMMKLAATNYKIGYQRIFSQDDAFDKQIIDNEDSLDFLNAEISDFLVLLANKVTSEDEKSVGSYFHVVNDIERIGDHAYNFYEMSKKMKENELKFSDIAKEEMEEMNQIIIEMFNVSEDIFASGEQRKLSRLKELEDKTDSLKIKLSDNHFVRITKNQCNNELSPFYTTLVSELERVADHLVNIGYSIVNPVGDAGENK